jgi:DHA1 family tetracycline resistance protein-like MFS transporter
MSRKYLVGPFLCFFAALTFSLGTLLLLPLYARQLGASTSGSGLFLGFAYLCLTLGNMAPALLPKGFRHRRVLLASAGLPLIVLAWLGGHVATALGFAVVTGVTWFFFGVVFSQAATLVGLSAEPADRGTAFGILGMASGLGPLIGGLALGPLADRFGYTVVFNSLAVFSILFVVGGLASVERPSIPASEDGAGTLPVRRPFGGFLIVLLLAQFLLAVTSGPSALGRSLSMDEGGFSKSAITLTGAIGGLVSLVIPLLAGRLSDRIGRRWVLIASFLVTSASLMLLAFSRALWQFCAFAVLNASFGVSGAVGPAYVVDIDPQGNVGRNVSFYQSALWVGCIAGMSSTGYALEQIGAATSILMASLFPVAAAILLLLIRSRPRGGDAQPSAVS